MRTNYMSEMDNPSSMKFCFHTRMENLSDKLSI